MLPQLQPFTFGRGPLNTGTVVMLPCTLAAGDRPVILQWLFDGQEIPSYLGLKVTELGDASSILSIGSINAKHAGRYTCIAKNEAGMDMHSSVLVVNGTKFVSILSCIHSLLCMFLFFFFIFV